MKVKLGGDFSKVPDSNPIPEGLYIFKLVGVDERESNKTSEPMVELKWSAVKDADGKKLKDAKGKAATYDPLFSYAPLDPDSSWARRMKELLHALGVKQSGTVDIKEGAEVLGRVKHQPNQDGDGTRPNITKLMKISDEPDEPDEDEPDEDEDDEGVDLSTLSRSELKKLIKEQELDISVKRSMSDDDIREAIAELLGEDEEEPDDEEEDEPDEEDEDEDDEDDEDDEEVDLSELSRQELKDFIKENELDISVKRSDTAETLRTKIADALEEDDEDDEDDEDEVEDNYDELDVKTLRQELKDRELDSTGKKNVLIARLRADDTSDPV